MTCQASLLAPAQQNGQFFSFRTPREEDVYQIIAPIVCQAASFEAWKGKARVEFAGWGIGCKEVEVHVQFFRCCWN